MTSPIAKNNLIDDLYLHKHNAVVRMRQIMSTVGSDGSDGNMVKVASSGEQNSLIVLFSKMLESLDMTINNGDIQNVINKMSISSSSLDKNAYTKNSQERSDGIKIVSKSIKDSHYHVDISKDIIKQDGKEVYMVSCYAKDAYLGRYLIKRNFFYTTDREKSADNAYDEIMTKVGAIKDRYYNEVIDTPEIFTQLKQVLDGVISEIAIKEDSIGTNFNR